MFVYNSHFGVNFSLELFFADREKIHKNRKN